MTKLNQIYKCNICGNMIEMVHPGKGTLVCCGQPMELLKEKTEDIGHEKHVPVVEKNEDGLKITIGSIPHPMANEHYIEWIEILIDNKRVYRAHLYPGDSPTANFKVEINDFEIRAYCNVHGLWKS